MADRAGVAERRCRVNRISRAIVIGLMARVTIRRRPGVHPIGMTASATGGNMGSRQLKGRLRVMIET